MKISIDIDLKNLQAELNDAVPDIIKEVERRISLIMEALSNNEKHFADLFLGGSQETQDCTKLFQYVVTPSIQYICELKGINLVKEEADGYDWIYQGERNSNIKIEQKVKTILKDGRTYDTFIKQDKLVNEGWTGNKAAAHSNSKTDTHLLWCFELRNSSIPSLFAAIVSLKENGCKWVTNDGKKGSYANLSLNPSNRGVYTIWGETIFTGYKDRQLKKARCWLQEVQ